MRLMIEFPDRDNCRGYQCTECNWHYDIRLFDINSAEYWIAARDFEMHDCRENKRNAAA
jgi:hypothetical protein